ncbi:MAG: L,D-transpeptidase [Synergistaceae bacterium]|nr:L,D-transpeptidase [Synergistaceae bacterium]
MIAAKLPEAEKLPVPEEPPLPEPQEETAENSIPPYQPVESIIIPLTTKRAEASPVENPNVSIWPPKEAKLQPAQKPAVNNGRYNIKIVKSTYTLALYKGTELVKEYPIAVGRNPGDKQRTGDNRTPTGNFKIVSIENASKWTHDFRDGKGKIAGAYGPWFLRLDAKGWKGIGIHGTHAPDSIGTRATEGCIRLNNSDIAELKQYAYRNMPVVISER